jgi:hypothetical protein
MNIRAHHLWHLSDLLRKFGNKIPRFSLDYREIPAIGNNHSLKSIAQTYILLLKEPDLQINIIDSLDDICQACGYHDSIRCKIYKYDLLKNTDDRTISKLKISYNTNYTSKEIIDKLKSHLNQ